MVQSRKNTCDHNQWKLEKKLAALSLKEGFKEIGSEFKKAGKEVGNEFAKVGKEAGSVFTEASKDATAGFKEAFGKTIFNKNNNKEN